MTEKFVQASTEMAKENYIAARRNEMLIAQALGTSQEQKSLALLARQQTADCCKRAGLSMEDIAELTEQADQHERSGIENLASCLHSRIGAYLHHEKILSGEFDAKGFGRITPELPVALSKEEQQAYCTGAARELRNTLNMVNALCHRYGLEGAPDESTAQPAYTGP